MSKIMKKCMKAKLKISIVTLGLALGSVTLAFADSPAVPAGSGNASAPANAPAPGLANGAQQPGGLMAFAPFLLMFAVLYFLVLRPQQKKMKEQQSMLSSL